MSHCLTEEQPAQPGFQPAEDAAGQGLYYGWIMLPMSMIALIASSPGQTFGVSIFNEPMRLSLGLTHGQLAAAYMLGTVLGALPITYIGYQMDRRSLRQTMLIVVCMFSAACLLTALVQGWLMLVGAFCLLRMLGPGALAFLSGNTLPFWFERRLGMVEGLRQLGMAAAMVMIPALNLWLVSQWGWRGAYAVLGVAVWLVLFPLFGLLYHNRPEDVGQHIDGKPLRTRPSPSRKIRAGFWGLTLEEALRTSAFWIVTAGTAVFGLIHTAVFFCLVPIFQERGLAESHAAATLTIFAICLAVMQLAGGLLADRVRAPRLLCVGLGGLAAAVMVLLSASSATGALVAGAMLGAAQGLFFGTAQPLWARYFGRRHLGKIRGVLMTINVGSSSTGVLLAGLTRDWLGNFGPVLVALAILPLPVACLSLLATPPQPCDEADATVPELATVEAA